MFPLSKYFSIASLFGITLVILALSILYKEVSLGSLTDQETRSNAALTKAFSNSLWAKHKNFVDQASSLSKSEIEMLQEYQLLDEDVRTMMKDLNVVKIKIYSLTGNTVYSTEPSQIGVNKSQSKGFLSAKSGKIVSELTFRNQFYALEGVVVGRSLISSYLPIQKNDHSPVEAVFELYSDVTELMNKLNASQNTLLGGLLIILTTLYFFLFFIIHHADNIMRRQEMDQLKHAEEIYQHTYHDSLTDLPNRKMFLKRLEYAVRSAKQNNKSFAVMIIDLDRFKNVNNSLGHEVGDRLLIRTGQRIKESIREIDTGFRIGTDEFTILTSGLNSETDAAAIARRIIESIAEPFYIDSNELIITTSIGIAIYPKDDTEIGKLAKHADAAMYKAKELGGNQFQFYTDDLNAQSLERMALETGLRKALENSEFELFYQPKTTSDGKQMVGMEALIRWRHPERGLLGPDQFLSCLEDTGLIIPVGEWVIQQACRDTKQWHVEGLPKTHVSVNLSCIQFRSDSLLTLIKDTLITSNLEAKYLEVEITESLLIENIEHTIETLDQIKTLGVSISIDDFGTGYSSLNYLRTFPIDYIKIDRSFVKDLETNNKDVAITSAIITLAHSLNMEIIAEGVETEQQMKFLREQGCQQIQGYLISKPIPISALKRLMKKKGMLVFPDENHRIKKLA